MAMNMGDAFAAEFLTALTKYSRTTGSFGAFNVFTEGTLTTTTIKGVLKIGNKFSEFDKGQVVKPMPGGERVADFRTLWIKSSRYSLDVKDTLGYKGDHFNIIQVTDNDEYGFKGYLLAKSKEDLPV